MGLNRRKVLSVLVLLLLSGSLLGFVANYLFPSAPPPSTAGRLFLETSVGRVVVELDWEAAPGSVGRLVEAVEEGFFDGLCFHSVIPGFVAMTGAFTPNGTYRGGGTSFGVEGEGELPNEEGTVGVVWTKGEGGGSTVLYFNLADNPTLDGEQEGDYGYVVVGRVVEGWEALEALSQVETTTLETAFGEVRFWPVEPVVVERAHLEGG